LTKQHQLDRSKVIGICGGSCSGKTWLSEQFKRQYPKPVCLFDLDGYYKNLKYVEKLEHQHDNPDAIEFADALSHLQQLKSGRAVEIPIYNFESHRQEGWRTCHPAPVIVVEGVFAFSMPQLVKEFDIKVWIEADANTRYQRRKDRDITARGRDALEVERRYERDVVPGYQKFIDSTRTIADITIHNSTNRDTLVERLKPLMAYCDNELTLENLIGLYRE
jgi:uridine kinase